MGVIVVAFIAFVIFMLFQKKEVKKPVGKVYPKEPVFPRDRTKELLLYLRNTQHNITTKEQIREILLSFNLNFQSSDPELSKILTEINEKINAASE